MQLLSSNIREKVQSAFNFEIGKFQLFGPDNMKTPFYGLFRSDSQSVVNTSSVSNRYVPHQTDDVLALVDAAGEAFDGEIDVNCHFRHGHYVSITPTKHERLQVFGDNDNVWPRVMIHAGYDGKSFSATMGYFRDLCSNLVMMRQIEGTTVSIRHTSGLRSQMNSLIGTFNTLKESWSNLSTIIRQLQGTEVAIVDFLNEVYPQPKADAGKREITIHENRTKAIFKRLRDEKFRSNRPSFDSDFTVTAWEAFNVVQAFVQHDAKGRTEFSSDFDRIIRASRDQYVRKAERMVLELVA